MPRLNRLRRSVLGSLGVLLLVAPSVAAERATDRTTRVISDSWYILEIAGSAAGWMHETTRDTGEHFLSAAETELRISRGAVELQVSSAMQFIETHDGKPVEMSMIQDFSLQQINARWIFRDDHVVSISNQDGREIRKQLPLPEKAWLSPRAVHRHWLAQREGGAEDITFRTLSGETGLTPITITMALQGEEQFALGGETIPVTVWKTSSSLMPGVTSMAKYTADGRQVYDELNTGFGTIVTRLATAEDAAAAGAKPAPEMMFSLFITPDRPIDRPMQTKRMQLRLRIRDGELPELPSAGAQRFTMEEGRKTARLMIDLDHASPATATERDDVTLLESSTLVDASDPLIAKLAARAARGAEDDDRMARALAIHRFVYEYVSAKSLDTAFASASETARTRAGDCSEHGMLLCAMLRSQGIPARLASGLVYADLGGGGDSGVYGWHIWTQALIDGHWVDLDATLPVRFHAGHVLTGTTTMSEGAGTTDLANMMSLLGNLDIDVIDVEHRAP